MCTWDSLATRDYAASETETAAVRFSGVPADWQSPVQCLVALSACRRRERGMMPHAVCGYLRPRWKLTDAWEAMTRRSTERTVPYTATILARGSYDLAWLRSAQCNLGEELGALVPRLRPKSGDEVSVAFSEIPCAVRIC